ncbi:MAG: outer membrane lipoprotein-sorting protein [bacterium]
MRRYIYLFAIPFLMSIFLIEAGQAVTDPDVMKIVKQIDELYRSNSSFAEVEMEIVTPHWQRSLKMKVWSKGMDKTFIRILSPRKERGVGTLRLGNEMWNYLPKVNKVVKVPPSMMMSSWMGSDFTNDDLVREYTFLEDYRFSLLTSGDIGHTADTEDSKEELIYVECRPKEGRPIVWDKVNIAVRASDNIPVWQKYYDEKGKVMRILYFHDIKTFGERRIPSVLEMVPQNKEGNKTVIRYLDIEFDQKIGDDVFSLRNLRERI